MWSRSGALSACCWRCCCAATCSFRRSPFLLVIGVHHCDVLCCCCCCSGTPGWATLAIFVQISLMFIIDVICWCSLLLLLLQSDASLGDVGDFRLKGEGHWTGVMQRYSFVDPETGTVMSVLLVSTRTMVCTVLPVLQNTCTIRSTETEGPGALVRRHAALLLCGPRDGYSDVCTTCKYTYYVVYCSGTVFSVLQSTCTVSTKINWDIKLCWSHAALLLCGPRDGHSDVCTTCKYAYHGVYSPACTSKNMYCI
jgi:hypothetical protein